MSTYRTSSLQSGEGRRDTDRDGRDEDAWRVLIDRGLAIACIDPRRVEAARWTLAVFRVGPRFYGIPAGYLLGVRSLDSYQPLPLTHPYIVGMVPDPNEALVVVDLRLLIGVAQQSPRPGTPFLVVRLDTMAVGLLIDEVLKPPAAFRSI